MRENYSIIRLLTIQLSILFLILAVGGGYFFINNSINQFNQESALLKQRIIDQNKVLLKTQVYNAFEYTQIERAKIIRLAKAELLRETTVLHEIMTALHQTLSINHKSRFFTRSTLLQTLRSYDASLDTNFAITSVKGISIYNPLAPKLEGSSVLHIRDAQQTRVTNEEIGMIRLSDEGFLSTFWKEGENLRQRVTFVKYFEPMDWYITTSVYLDSFTQKIQKNMFTHLANLRFGTNDEGYFFINTTQGDVVLSLGKVNDPRPNLWDVEDPNGIKVVQQNTRIAIENREEGGFSTYSWQKLDGTLSPKISFVRMLPGWDMYIGAGVSLDTVEKAIAQERKKLKETITKRVYGIFGLFIFAFLLMFGMMFFFTKRLKKNVNLFFDTFHKATTEYTTIPDEKIHFSEFQLLANGINTLLTTLKEQQEEIYHRASHDYLTDLPNRLLLTDRLNLALMHAKRSDTQVAVAFMDLDHFKKINDTLGHESGDILLQKMVQKLQIILRKSDTVARIGGDEFIFILPNVSKDSYFNEFIERILSTINQPFTINDRIVQVSGSLGITLYPDDGEGSEELIKNADIAMYEAKNKGRNNFQFFNPVMNAKIHESIQLEKEIAQGIKNSEFELYYQPKVSIHSKKITGAEALIRWNHPTRGLTFPDTFITIAEESGQLFELGEWVLRQACRQLALWEAQGKSLKMAVNVSVKQLEHPDFVNVVKRVMKETGICPELLEVEITESFSADNQANIEALFQIKALGVNLAIDDFGTGYSSLSYLNKLPIDTLKIDRSFVTDMLDNTDKLALVEIIIQTAKILKLHTIAEGVEHQGEVALLKTLSCNEYQGYFFSRPIPIAQFEALLESKS